MTTQVAVANLDGIAVASDTLVTFGQKSLDGARKIYELGDGHQVLVMHSGRATISGTSQYLHFVEWTKTLAEPLPKLTDYIDNYMAWSGQANAVVTEDGQKQSIHFLLNDHYYWMRDKAMYPRLTADKEDGTDFTDTEQLEITDGVIREGAAYLKGLDSYDGVTAATSKAWLTKYKIDLDDKLNYIFDGYPITDAGRTELKSQAHLLLQKAQDMDTDSLIAFVGYGADEPYPGVVRMRLRGIIGGQVLATVQDSMFIAPDNTSTVHYFAQADAMRALVTGAHWRIISNLRSVMMNSLGAQFESVSHEDISEIVDNIFERSDAFSHNEFVSPFLDTVAAMGVGKLASLADSMIQLQLTAAHSDTERSTIGGTIEVAIIDRQHGVRWVSKLKEDVLPGH